MAPRLFEDGLCDEINFATETTVTRPMAIALDPVDALNFWHKTIVHSLRRKAPDLTTRQMAILLTVYLESSPHTVRGLAKNLNISKPAVTRALDRLGALDFTRRKRDVDDGRNVLVQRTVKGSVYLREFADAILAASGNGQSDP